MCLTHPSLHSPLAHLYTPSSARSKRASSWDRTGANQDYIRVESGEVVVLLEQDGPGCLTHLYCAMILPDVRDYRNAILRCYWDGADDPSVEVPLGDFFGVMHARARTYSSFFVAVNDGFGSSHGLNAYFPMPFSDGARVTLENRGPAPLGGAIGAFWYHVDYETYDDPLPPDTGRFHACWRQERPTVAIGPEPNVTLHNAVNLDGADNYVALDTSGAGRMVGVVLEVENVQGERWYGEGDDMVFVDGERWPPSIHGTGSEEIFGGGACPAFEYAGVYTGYPLIESNIYDGLVGMYRWFVHDPIHFATSLRWTIEHGHANNFANNYSSVAYWYQSPGAALPGLPDVGSMLPSLPPEYDEARALLGRVVGQAMRLGDTDPTAFLRAAQAGRALYRGDFTQAIEDITAFRDSLA